MADIPKFKDGELLKAVREKTLEPLVDAVNSLVPKVDEIDTEIQKGIYDAGLDPNAKKMTLTKKNGDTKDLDFQPWFDDIPAAMDVQEDGKAPISGIDKLKFSGLEVTGPTTENGKKTATIKYTAPDPLKGTVNGRTGDVAEIVVTGAASASGVANNKLSINIPDFSIQGTVGTDTEVVNKIVVSGPGGSTVSNGTLSITIPPSSGGGGGSDIEGEVTGGAKGVVTKILVDGGVGSSSFTDGLLKIDLPTGGTGKVNQNFKGFYDNLGDLISEVDDPMNGRSFAFVKDTANNVQYYTAYMYINNAWAEVTQDPAVTYSPPDSANVVGVNTIKPDNRIIIDAKGQLDLSGLATDEARLHFHGFYDTVAELNAAVPNPVENMALAYTKHTNGAWIGRQYRRDPQGNLVWGIMAPISAFSLVNSPGDPSVPAAVFGFYKNDMLKVDANGLLTIQGEADATINGEVQRYDGSSTYLDFNKITLKNGTSFAKAEGKTLVLENPQRVIDYNATWESQHNTLDYMGNIFYDKTSRSWMGWAEPEAPGAVGHKWTRLAHEGMGDEVKSLTYRFPRFIPEVAPGPTGDVRNWEFSSWTYLQADSSELPDPIQSVGGYITTFVRKTVDEVGAPSKRIQQCIADNSSGDTFVRKFNPDAATGDPAWHPWVKVSMSQADIDRHNRDPNAHKGLHKFYRVLTLDMTYALLKSYSYSIRDKQMLLLADSHGMGDIADDHTIIPYDGKFNLSGRFAMEGWTGTAINSQWVLKVARIRAGATVVICEATYNNTNTPKIHLPPIEWDFKGVDLLAGDKLIYSFKCLTDTTFATNYPALRILPNRSYFVVEDARTISGSRIAETQRKLQGALNTKDSVGINVHYASGTSGSIRMYGAAIPSEYRPMTQV